MAGYRQIERSLFLRHRHHPARIIALLELDADRTLQSRGARPTREYARLWGVTRKVARRLVEEYRPLFARPLRVDAARLWHLRTDPDQVVRLIELDLDLRAGALASRRHYAQIWGVTERHVRTLIARYRSDRVGWTALDLSRRVTDCTGPEAAHERPNEPTESLRKWPEVGPKWAQSGPTTLEGRGGTQGPPSQGPTGSYRPRPVETKRRPAPMTHPKPQTPPTWPAPAPRTQPERIDPAADFVPPTPAELDECRRETEAVLARIEASMSPEDRLRARARRVRRRQAEEERIAVERTSP